ncbi:MAG: hypothetical protein RLZZ241_1843 [Bacteroidota bacterium]|jgi:histidinol-phosphate aminotransferase
MKQTDRRNWLKTIALGSSLTLLGGTEVFPSFKKKGHFIESGPIRLNSNENPYGPSAGVREAIMHQLDVACRYPSAYLAKLTREIANKEEIDPSCVVITGGSTEGLKAAGLTFGLHGREIIAADPTFQALLTYGEYFGAHVHRVPLTPNFTHDLEAMEKRITSNTGLIFICNPNNPTGTLLPEAALKDFILSSEQRAVIFSDEAYYDYIELPEYPSMIDFVKQGRNVVVSKTFSKVYGLAGMRIGYLIARPDIATRIKKSIMANTNSLAIVAASTALTDAEFYKFSVSKNLEAKRLLYEGFEAMNVPYIPSHTNFVFFKSGIEVGTLNRQMLELGVQIGRPFPPLTNWARVSTGIIEDIPVFISSLEKLIN